MKFSFPFFKKKSDSLPKQEEEKPVEQEIEVTASPKVDWGSVKVDSVVLPSSPTQSDPADGMASFEVLDLPPLSNTEPETDIEVETFTSPNTDPETIAAPIAAEPEEEVIPTPVKVTPQASPAPTSGAVESVTPLETKSESQLETQPAVQPAAPTAEQPLLMAKEDVIAAYKIFLDRLPESNAVMNQRIGASAEANLIQFMLADEFLKRPEVKTLILGLAKQIIERQKMASASAEIPREG
jgi:hypothetical protein